MSFGFLNHFQWDLRRIKWDIEAPGAVWLGRAVDDVGIRAGGRSRRSIIEPQGFQHKIMQGVVIAGSRKPGEYLAKDGVSSIRVRSCPKG